MYHEHDFASKALPECKVLRLKLSPEQGFMSKSLQEDKYPKAFLLRKLIVYPSRPAIILNPNKYPKARFASKLVPRNQPANILNPNKYPKARFAYKLMPRSRPANILNPNKCPKARFASKLVPQIIYLTDKLNVLGFRP